jgi:hypothetical protein
MVAGAARGRFGDREFTRTTPAAARRTLMRNILVASALLGALFWRPDTALAQAPGGSGNVTTIAGSGMFPAFSGDGGPATDALINTALGTAIGRDGALYFFDYYNFRIRRIDPVTRTISTIAGNRTPASVGAQASIKLLTI